MFFEPERSIFMSENINDRGAINTIVEVTKLHSANPELPITLFVNSGGGNVTDAFALYDYIMHALKPNLQTVVLGEANSMAVLLLLMGDSGFRFISRLAVMKFHRFSLTVNASFTVKNGLKMIQDLEKSEENYIEILVQRTGGKINKEIANKLLSDNVTLTAAEAVEFGLAQTVL